MQPRQLPPLPPVPPAALAPPVPPPPPEPAVPPVEPPAPPLAEASPPVPALVPPLPASAPPAPPSLHSQDPRPVPSARHSLNPLHPAGVMQATPSPGLHGSVFVELLDDELQASAKTARVTKTRACRARGESPSIHVVSLVLTCVQQARSICWLDRGCATCLA
jgi:hypothetical protein